MSRLGWLRVLLTAAMATGCGTDAAPAPVGEHPENLSTAQPQRTDLDEEICPQGGSRFRCYARIRVDAVGYSNAESDLAAYRSRYTLPPCTVASGCLTIVNQMGQPSPLPQDAPL